jgi:hypothetical protein
VKPKLPLLLTALVAAGALFTAWTQSWILVDLVDGESLAVDGSAAAPAASILALTTIVLTGALAIAGPVFRVILGGLEALLGVTVVISSIGAITDSIHAAAPTVSAATGIAGTASVAQLVSTIGVTAWPFVAVVAGVLIVVAGVLVIVTSRSWPDSGRRYSAVRTEPATGTDAADSWDALSAGNDPTDDR